jgi:hypothetical protein
VERRLARLKEHAHRALGRDALVARRTAPQVLLDAAAISGGELLVDVWGDERIDQVAAIHDS